MDGQINQPNNQEEKVTADVKTQEQVAKPEVQVELPV